MKPKALGSRGPPADVALRGFEGGLREERPLGPLPGLEAALRFGLGLEGSELIFFFILCLGLLKFR